MSEGAARNLTYSSRESEVTLTESLYMNIKNGLDVLLAGMQCVRAKENGALFPVNSLTRSISIYLQNLIKSNCTLGVSFDENETVIRKQ